MGLLLGLVCDRPAVYFGYAVLQHEFITGTISDPNVLRILAPLVLEPGHIDHLAEALQDIVPATN